MKENKNSEERNNRIDQYNLRMALLKSKYPKILEEAPNSIQNEFIALTRLVNYLQTTNRGIRGEVMASDGNEIDGFIKDKYENAIKQYQESYEQNKEYISEEEEQNFKLPEVNVEEIKARIENMQDVAEYENMRLELVELKNFQPVEVKKQIKNLENQLAIKTRTLHEEKSHSNQQAPKPIRILRKGEKYAQTINPENLPAKKMTMWEKIKSRFSQIKDNIKSRFINKDSNLEQKDEIKEYDDIGAKPKDDHEKFLDEIDAKDSVDHQKAMENMQRDQEDLSREVGDNVQDTDATGR